MRQEIESWFEYPNALGSEAQAAVLVGRIAGYFQEPTPLEVSNALRVLSLRAILREAFQGIGRAPDDFHGGIPAPPVPLHHLADATLICGGVSWTEAVAEIAKFLQETIPRFQESYPKTAK